MSSKVSGHRPREGLGERETCHRAIWVGDKVLQEEVEYRGK